MTPPRWLVQLSDLPWLVVAGALGLLVELGLGSSGVAATSPWWVFPVRGAVAAGGVCGWLAFRFGRSFAGAFLGGMAGCATAFLPPFLLSAAGVASWPVSLSLTAALGVAWTLIPPLTHTLVLPLLFFPPIRRLAAHHPRWSHLRLPPDAPTP